jgi:hypothetical protein
MNCWHGCVVSSGAHSVDLAVREEVQYTECAPPALQVGITRLKTSHRAIVVLSSSTPPAYGSRLFCVTCTVLCPFANVRKARLDYKLHDAGEVGSVCHAAHLCNLKYIEVVRDSRRSFLKACMRAHIYTHSATVCVHLFRLQHRCLTTQVPDCSALQPLQNQGVCELECGVTKTARVTYFEQGDLWCGVQHVTCGHSRGHTQGGIRIIRHSAAADASHPSST